MAAVYPTSKAAHQARESRARQQATARHGVTILDLQKRCQDLLQRVEDLEEYNIRLEACNSTLAYEHKAEVVEKHYYRRLFTALFMCSIVFCLMTIICLGTILYFPAGVFPFAALGFLGSLLFIGVLALLHELV
jgi:hypothetical protein